MSHLASGCTNDVDRSLVERREELLSVLSSPFGVEAEGGVGAVEEEEGVADAWLTTCFTGSTGFVCSGALTFSTISSLLFPGSFGVAGFSCSSDFVLSGPLSFFVLE